MMDSSESASVPLKISTQQWQQLIELVRTHHRFLLTTHVNPDGDGIGSQLGLGRFLKKLGKEVWIVNDSPLTPFYQFLDPEGLVQGFAKAEAALQESPPEVVILLDIGALPRLGLLDPYLRSSQAFVLCLDHHQPGPDDGLDLQLIDVEAPATGELVYQFTQFWPEETLTQEIATPLYAALLTDTGCFAHTNATARAHRAAAALLDAGVSHLHVYRHMFQRSSLGRYKLLASLMLHLQTSEEHSLAWMQVTQDMLQEFGISSDEVNQFAESPRVVDGIEAIVLFLESDDRKFIKMSFRSKGRANVLQVAQNFGGGGHRHAAGARLSGSMAIVVKQVLPVAAAMIGSQLGIKILLPSMFSA